MKTDADEKELLESVERREWKSVCGGKPERTRYARYAKATRASHEGFAVDRSTGQRRSATQERTRAETQDNGHPVSWRRSR
jgi:hypothetical protein